MIRPTLSALVLVLSVSAPSAAADPPPASSITYTRDLALPPGFGIGPYNDDSIIGLESMPGDDLSSIYHCDNPPSFPRHRLLVTAGENGRITSLQSLGSLDGDTCPTFVYFTPMGMILAPRSTAAAYRPQPTAPHKMDITGGGFNPAVFHVRLAPPGLQPDMVGFVLPTDIAAESTYGYRFLLIADTLWRVDSDGPAVWPAAPLVMTMLGSGVTGSGIGELRNPTALEVGPDGLIYVLDAGNSRVQIFDAAGVYQRQFALAPGTTATAGFDIGPDGRVYITNGAGGATVYGSSGIVFGTFGTSVNTPIEPAKIQRDHILIDPDGRGLVLIDRTGVHEFSITPPPYQFVGFAHPLENAPAINRVQPGASAPLHWRVLDDDNQPVLTLTGATLSVQHVACDSGEPIGSPAVDAIAPRLGDDGEYSYVLRMPKWFAQTCQAVTLDIGDGVPHTVLFSVERPSGGHK